MAARSAPGQTPPRFSIGIDLGTTNSALACADLGEHEGAAAIDIVEIPQLVEPGEVSPRTLLPSFAYLVGEFDFPAGSLRLPWTMADDSPGHIVGELARKRGAETPVRLVSSAKSWLSHAAASRTAPILPWVPPTTYRRFRR